jgi:hypothetical protein
MKTQLCISKQTLNIITIYQEKCMPVGFLFNKRNGKGKSSIEKKTTL